jgi:hypothetical protein
VIAHIHDHLNEAGAGREVLVGKGKMAMAG